MDMLEFMNLGMPEKVPQNAKEAAEDMFPICEHNLQKFGNHVPTVVIFSPMGLFIAQVIEQINSENGKENLAHALRALAQDPKLQPYGIAMITEVWLSKIRTPEAAAEYRKNNMRPVNDPNRIEGVSILVSWHDGQDTGLFARIIRKVVDGKEQITLVREVAPPDEQLTGRFIGLFKATAQPGDTIH